MSLPRRKWLPVVDATRCTGCGHCVAICGLGLRKVVNGRAVLVDADPCPTEELCVVACPAGAITMQWVELPITDSSVA